MIEKPTDIALGLIFKRISILSPLPWGKAGQSGTVDLPTRQMFTIGKMSPGEIKKDNSLLPVMPLPLV